MNYEKKYKELVGKIKRAYLNAQTNSTKAVLEDILPELKESKNKRVRKRLIDLIYKVYTNTNYITCAEHEEMLSWLEKQGEPQVRTGIEWLNAIDDACDKRYSEGYAEGEYCHEQSFKWGFQEGVAWLEKQGDNNNQNWKPSKEQISALEHFVRSIGESGYASPYDSNTNLLYSLINDLYKLEKQGEQNTNHKTMSVKFICKKDWHGIGDYCYGKVYNGYPCEKEQRGYDVYDDNHIPTFCDEDFINEYFNIIEEKQGEKPQGKTAFEAITEVHNANKVEPKFHEGDWIVQEDVGVYRVIEVCESWYEVVDNEDNHYSIPFDEEYMCHLWSIQDAKAGDVLISRHNKPFIYNGNRNHFNVGSYCGISIGDRFNVNSGKSCFWTENVKIYPATKEQRDLLFKKMKEAGYEWDAEKKELKKGGEE